MRKLARPRKRGVILRRSSSTGLGTFTPAPVRAVVVALDAASTTGHATYVSGRLYRYGELDAYDPAARFVALRNALTAGALHGLPVAVVCEAPFGGHVSAAVRLTAVVALWRDTWLQLGGRSGVFLECTARDWRRELFGRRALTRRAARVLEARVAFERARRDLPGKPHAAIGGDAAAAICLGQVATRSSAVAAALRLGGTTNGRTYTTR